MKNIFSLIGRRQSELLFYVRLLFARKGRKITQKDIANMAATTQRTVSNIEAGECINSKSALHMFEAYALYWPEIRELFGELFYMLQNILSIPAKYKAILCDEGANRSRVPQKYIIDFDKAEQALAIDFKAITA